MEKEMMEKLKNNNVPTGLLPDEFIIFLMKQSPLKNLQVYCGENEGWKLWGRDLIQDTSTYRLRPNFEQPEEKKRWFFTTDTNHIRYAIGGRMFHFPENVPSSYSLLEVVKNHRFLEVGESDLPYLKKPEGEWEFRKVERGDEFRMYSKDVALTGTVKTAFDSDLIFARRHLSGYRWCKARKAEGRWETIIENGCGSEAIRLQRWRLN